MSYNFIKFKHCGYISDRIKYYIKSDINNISSNDVSDIILSDIWSKLKDYNLDRDKEWYNNNVDIYTDGACSGNPGHGGYGAILLCNGHKKYLKGYYPDTTNNQMEIVAVIQSLLSLNKCCENVHIYTDSNYVVQAFNNDWLYNWVKNDWVNKSNKNVANRELWEILLYICSFHHFTFHKVKAHSDNIYNNLADKLATGKF